MKKIWNLGDVFLRKREEKSVDFFLNKTSDDFVRRRNGDFVRGGGTCLMKERRRTSDDFVRRRRNLFDEVCEKKNVFVSCREE